MTTARTILVVDDDKGDRKLIARLLGRAGRGYRVCEAADGPSAVAADLDQVDAVLVDHLLPGRTGLDLLSSLRERWPHAAILLMTGQGSEEIAKTAIKRGANDYLPKDAMTEASLVRSIETGIEVAQMHWRLEEKRRDLELFSHVLLHDIKEPIRNIRFLTDQLGDDARSGRDTDMSRDLALLERSARQMSELVDSLASHIQLDEERPRVTVAAHEVIAAALNALSIELRQTGATVEVSGGDVLLNCDAPQIAQVVQNLVANGIKYVADVTPEIRVDVGTGPDVTISVSDNGIGIPEAYRETVFEPFRRASNAETVAGSGLGLATCRKIALNHEGRIWCEPGKERGTVFHLRLPATEPLPTLDGREGAAR